MAGLPAKYEMFLAGRNSMAAADQEEHQERRGLEHAMLFCSRRGQWKPSALIPGIGTKGRRHRIV